MWRYDPYLRKPAHMKRRRPATDIPMDGGTTVLMRRTRDITTVILVLAGLGFSQNPASTEQETVRLLVQQVHELQEKVKALESKSAVSGAAAGEAPIEAPSAETAPETSPAPPPVLHEQHGIQWRGFAEVNYKVLDQRQPELGTFGFVPGSAGNSTTATSIFFSRQESTIAPAFWRRSYSAKVTLKALAWTWNAPW
jgi:hypothetical protein